MAEAVRRASGAGKRAFALLALALVAAAPLPPATQLHRLDLLPRFRDVAAIGMFSSYDRTGGNDDGFEGTHSFIGREPGGLVIAEMQGPGAITRIWTPTPSDDLIEFYFDGEAAPRIRERFSDLFRGTRFPFVAGVSGVGAGGFYTYAPLAYARSMKVVVRADRFNFYQINYVTYPPDAPVAAYAPGGSPQYRQDLAQAARLFAAQGDDISAEAAGGAPVLTHRARATVPPGGRATLFERRAPGRIVALKLSPASALAGPERDLTLHIFYEGERDPSVSVPAGDFFGYAWGQPAMRSLLLGTDDNTSYAYLPMPFDRAVRIELASARDAPVTVEAEIRHSIQGRRPDEGRLYALWRRENPTTAGRPFTFVEARGRGHLVGAVLQAQGEVPGTVPEYFEGDDRTTIDGEVRIRGTGSEDFFNGGWYDVPGRWDGRVSMPLSGSLGYDRHLARTGGYRFMLADAYPFTRSLTQTIEHGPSGNRIPTDHVGVTFLYADRAPAPPALPPVAQRAVVQPREAVFTPGWTTPVHAFSWANATLAKADEPVGGEKLRHLQFRATGPDIFGPPYISFGVSVPETGRYAVLLQAIAGPTQGRVQLFRNEVALGSPVELYAPARAKTAELKAGELALDAGPATLMFKLVGQHERASAMSFDLYRLILRRVD